MKTIDKIRFVLNTLFLIGAAVTLILYITIGSHDPIFYYVGFASLSFKVLEFILRFVY